MCLTKKKRIVDKTLLSQARECPCVVCYTLPTDPAHVRSVGSGGGDTSQNIISLCRTHHSLQHLKGWIYMWDNFDTIRRELILKGWGITENGLRRDADSSE